MNILRLCLILLCLPASLVQAQTRRPPVEADRVIAVVNSEAITLYELRSRLSTVKRQLRNQKIPLPPDDQLERQLLERMIVDKAQIQFAKESGITINDSELDGAMRRIAENNRLGLAEFRTKIEKDGVSWSRFRDEIREEMTIARLRDREVDNRVSISEGEIDNYLSGATAANSAEFGLAHIIIRLPEQANPEQMNRLRNKAEQALKQIRAGEDFAKIAATVSDAPDALSGGAMGVRPLDSLPSLYAEEAQKLAPGQVSGILRSPAGFHILKLVSKRGGAIPAQAVRQTRARHILIKVNEIVSDDEAKRKLIGLKERIDHGAKFAELARLHSNDLSATKGGDLGWLHAGDTVPEFEKGMDALPLNKVSEPIRSPFGWHLIEVQERRNNEASQERQRLAARQALRERKGDEAYQDWLRQMRDRAYVEYRFDEK